MGVFERNERTDPGGLDWSILQNGWASLYWRTQVLEEDITWFRLRNYVIIEFDCKTWATDKIMHSQLRDHLSFPDYYGENFNALRDCLPDLKIIKTGIVVVFRHMDHIKNITAHALLDIFADSARSHMLFGNRIITLVQVNNPDYTFEPIGHTNVIWNKQEWTTARRTNEQK